MHTNCRRDHRRIGSPKAIHVVWAHILPPQLANLARAHIMEASTAKGQASFEASSLGDNSTSESLQIGLQWLVQLGPDRDHLLFVTLALGAASEQRLK